jgi:hypothetical protein
MPLGDLRCWTKVEAFGTRSDGKAHAFQTPIQPQETGQVAPVLGLVWTPLSAAVGVRNKRRAISGDKTARHHWYLYIRSGKTVPIIRYVFGVSFQRLEGSHR